MSERERECGVTWESDEPCQLPFHRCALFEGHGKTHQCVCLETMRLPEAVAGNASAPVGEPPHCPSCNTSLPDLDYRAEGATASWVAREVGEPRIVLDTCFGDPFVWSEGADHSDALASNDWILIKAPALRALAAREVGEGLREAVIEECAEWLAQNFPHNVDILGAADAMEAALAAPAPKPDELRGEQCEHGWYQCLRCAAPKPAPPAEPLNVKEYLDLALRIQRVGAEHPYKLEHVGVNQGMWVCQCGEVLGDQPIDEIDAVAEQHISKFVAELVRRAAERKPPR